MADSGERTILSARAIHGPRVASSVILPEEHSPRRVAPGDRHELVLNWFRAEGKHSVCLVEGFSNKPKLITRKSYGFRTQEAYETVLYHNLGALPKLTFTHEFL